MNSGAMDDEQETIIPIEYHLPESFISFNSYPEKRSVKSGR